MAKITVICLLVRLPWQQKATIGLKWENGWIACEVIWTIFGSYDHLIIVYPVYEFHDQGPFCLVAIASKKFIKHQLQGKKTQLSTNRERRPFCTLAGNEGPAAHQHGKKTLLGISRKRSLCWACLLSGLVWRHRRCSIGGSGQHAIEIPLIPSFLYLFNEDVKMKAWWVRKRKTLECNEHTHRQK